MILYNTMGMSHLKINILILLLDIIPRPTVLFNCQLLYDQILHFDIVINIVNLWDPTE